jgi:hypothetical protein
MDICENCPDKLDDFLRAPGISERNIDGLGWIFRLVISGEQSQDQAVSTMECPSDGSEIEATLKTSYCFLLVNQAVSFL